MIGDRSSASRSVSILVYTPEYASAEQCRSIILDAFPGLAVSCASSMSEAMDGIEQIEIMYGWMIPRELYKHAISLRWVQKMGAGVDDIVVNRDIGSDIVLTRTPGRAMANTMADYVLAAILNFRLRTKLGYELQHKRLWQEYSTKPMAKTVGIAGVGEVGAVIARRLRQVDMDVIGWRRTTGDVPGLEIQTYNGNQGLKVFLERSDCVVLVLPLTSTTRFIINSKTIEMMKDGTHLINVGRGDLVDEEALVEALTTGRLGAATLDVVQSEPLDAQSVLWDCPNLVITPHISGPLIPEQVAPYFVENLRRYFEDEALDQMVDRQRGY